jgi:hypothetical protein
LNEQLAEDEELEEVEKKIPRHDLSSDVSGQLKEHL